MVQTFGAHTNTHSEPVQARHGAVFQMLERATDCSVAKNAEQALRESQQEARRLSGLLISIQENERRRIALDLHDGLGQSLSLIKLSIEDAARLVREGQSARAEELMCETGRRVREAMSEVRRVSGELRPSMLDDLGILPTLSWFFREFETSCAWIRVEKTIAVAEHEVPVPLQITLYRILQEAFHNIVEHSCADRVRVRIERSDGRLHLHVEDNGRGFDPLAIAQRGTQGLGLLSMKERASFSGGTYRLRSAPGEGTSISVSWPCEAAG